MDTEITIIGAGVVGLALAARLAEHGRSVCVLEKEAAWGRGTSSRNSEVIHAGIYYVPGSLKAPLCLEGRDRLYEICCRNGIPHKRIGKIIIAANQDEIAGIEKLRLNAHRCGVDSVKLLNRREVMAMEPNILAIAALHSPDTGIISAHALMDFYAHQAQSHGCSIVCGTQAVAISAIRGGYNVETVNLQNERFTLQSERIINAAGLHSDTVAKLAGINDYTLHYCKGDYCGIADALRGKVNRLVYPVPEKNHVGLGVHLTIDLNGHMKLGPDTEYIERTENYAVAGGKAQTFYRSASQFLPFLTPADVTAEMAGIRPKLQGPHDGVKDFVIKEDLPGFINLIGIESPGLTASPAIARYVEELLA